MTRNESAIISAYTGILSGPFDAFHEYIEKLLGRPVMTHELADNKVAAEIKQKSKPDFIKMVEGIIS